jgi:hypothetical protein
MSGQTAPVYIYYDCRGHRVRKRFDEGASSECRRFYIAKSISGKNPKLVKATDEMCEGSTGPAR